MQNLNTYLDQHIPLTKVKIGQYKKEPRLPWVSKMILRSINRKNNLYYINKLKRTENSRVKYTTYKNTLIKILRAEKRKYYMNQLNLFKYDMRNTWRIINNAMNNLKQQHSITKINYNNVEIDDDKLIPNVFNMHFSQIGQKLAQSISIANKNFIEYLGPLNNNSLFLIPIVRSELIELVKQMPSKKSAGHDGIDNVLLKNIVLFYQNDQLQVVFNVSGDSMNLSPVIGLFTLKCMLKFV